MGASHTPGPWQWDGYRLRPADPDPQAYAVHTIVDAEYLGWGFLCSDPKQTAAETDANLRLIAAAPQLLDAVKAAEAMLTMAKLGRGPTDPASLALSKLRAAIASATVTPSEEACHG